MLYGFGRAQCSIWARCIIWEVNQVLFLQPNMHTYNFQNLLTLCHACIPFAKSMVFDPHISNMPVLISWRMPLRRGIRSSSLHSGTVIIKVVAPCSTLISARGNKTQQLLELYEMYKRTKSMHAWTKEV